MIRWPSPFWTVVVAAAADLFEVDGDRRTWRDVRDDFAGIVCIGTFVLALYLATPA